MQTRWASTHPARIPADAARRGRAPMHDGEMGDDVRYRVTPQP